MRTLLLAASLATSAVAQSFQLVDAAVLGNGENIYPAYPFAKTLAVTRDGLMFTSGQFNTSAGPELRIYRSSDGGASWQFETRARMALSGLGSLVAGADGYTLHVAWGFSQASVGSVAYAAYDTRLRSWIGTDQVVFQGGATQNDGYHWPDVDVGADGQPVVVCTTHRGQGWSARLRWFDGQAWSAEQIINVDLYGVFVNLAVDRAGDFHFAYRTNSGGYGIRYRRFERATQSFGAEGEIPVFAGTANVSSLAIDDAGNRFVLYTRNQSLELAVLAAGAAQFQSTQVAADTGYTIGNVNWMNFALAEIDGAVWALYSYRDRGMDEVFTRIWASGMLGPELSLLRQVGRRHEFLAGRARLPQRLSPRVLVTAEDSSAGTRELRAWTPAAALVPFGRGCAGSGGFVPAATCVDLPTVGNSQFALRVLRVLGGTAAVAMVGTRDNQFAGVPLPLDLTPLGMTACALFQNLVLLLPATATGSGPGAGDARTALPIPNDPALSGNRLFVQWLVVDLAANPAGLLTSDAAAVLLR